MTMYLEKTPMLVKRIDNQTANISVFELVPQDGEALPQTTAGSHIMCHLDNGLVRQYSLINKGGKADSYQIAVLNDPDSRGGSRYIHENIHTGRMLTVSGPKNDFSLVLGAEKSVLIGGGIGITPMLSMARTLHAEGEAFELHYCAKSPETAAFVNELTRCDFADNVSIYYSKTDTPNRVDLSQLLSEIEPGKHVFCCGPEAMMDAVKAATMHWPRGSVHFEKFKAGAIEVQEDRPFDLRLSKSDKVLHVPAEKTAIEVLAEHHYEVDMVCGEGVCGACLVNVVDGDIEHRDQVLTDDEKSDNDVMTVCCSRAKSSSLTLDL